ncbi:MAG TPA: hypothetical protein VFO98_15080 [Marmoricola sp.]|nr:hypothetical protein [Marmoricola sp.]
MASNLGCIGLQPESEDGLLDLLNAVESAMRPVGRTDGGADVLQWTDESGARLTLTVSGDDIVDLVPSFAARTGVSLGGAQRQGEYVVADVLDAEGEQTTRLLCELEQAAFLPADGASGAAALTVFGLDVSVHADESAFATSDDSVATPGDPRPRPAELPPGFPWPPRLAAESFASLGLFDGSSDSGRTDAEPYARVTARVTEVETRTNSRTGQQFHAVQASCRGMDLVVCLAAADHPAPSEGNIVSGITYVVASLPSLWPSAGRDQKSRAR